MEGEINIKDIFKDDELTETTQGYKTECPDCGLQGGRTEGFILFPETNTSYCHSSGKWFKLLETYALKKQIIKCLDGRETGDSSSKILGGELFTITLDEFKNEYGTDKYNQLIQQLGIKKRIELPNNGKLISDFCDELGDIYKSRNVLFYRNESDDIIEIKRKIIRGENNIIYTEKGFKKVEGNRFITLAEMFIEPWTVLYTKTGNRLIINKSMNQSTANVVLQSPNFQNKIPSITRLFDIQIPILYKGKLTFPKKGYDKRFESWLPYNAPQIKENLYTLEEAKQLIDKIFEEFCFETEKDRTHAITAFLTPFFRGLYPKFSTRTPVFIYMANRERAGKDYCAGCAGILYEGVNVEQPAISCDDKYSNSNEEIRKKITACMLQGKKRFHSANNKGYLNNSIFEGITTAETWEDRILGRSETTTLNNEMDYSLSGNLGITLTPDLANRSRIINLHLIDEDANSRVFNNPNLHQWILDNRESIISAMFTLVKNWFDKGCPKSSLPFTSFPYWSNICGGIMETSGYNNPCNIDRLTIIALDSKTEEMKRIFEVCYEKKPNEWMTVKEIREVLEQEGIIHIDKDNKSETTIFGKKIHSYYNRILSGIIMKVDDEPVSYRKKYRFVKLANIDNICERSPIPPYPSIKGFIEDRETPANVIEVSNKLETLDDFSRKFKEYKKQEELKQNPQKEITDREVQFWEAEECKEIIEQCSKEQVLEWIRGNPKKNFEEMGISLGLGCFKHVGTLLNENIIKSNSENGWEIINDIHT